MRSARQTASAIPPLAEYRLRGLSTDGG